MRLPFSVSFAFCLAVDSSGSLFSCTHRSERFFKGVSNLYLAMKPPVTSWCAFCLSFWVNHVNICYHKSMPTCIQHNVSDNPLLWHVGPVSEWCALHSDCPFIGFHPDKLVLRPDIAFCPRSSNVPHQGRLNIASVILKLGFKGRKSSEHFIY